MKNPSPSQSAGILRKLAIFGLFAVAGCYVLGVAAGYGWLRFARKNEQVGILDVALFRFTVIRHHIAAQHFQGAQSEWEKKNFQQAFLLFSAAVRQDPDNIPGRLTAVKFLREAGGRNLALTMLQEGLERAPEDRRLIEPTFELLLTSGRERQALELLRKEQQADKAGKNEALFARYEVEATLAADGVPAARQVLERHPQILRDPLASRIVARVLWESQERLRAITVLREFLQSNRGDLADYTLLAGWQENAGQAADAVQTARRAIEMFPRESTPRVLLIEMLVAESPAGPNAPKAMAEFLRDYGSRPESIQELAALAGRKGWVDLCRSLYDFAANSRTDLNALALFYSDALARVTRFKEASRVLTDLEAQSPDGSAAFVVQLRQRQVIVYAALGDSENVRESARRLAAVLSHEPDGLEACRKIFQRLGIVDAVKELSGRSLVASAAPVKK